MIGVRELCKMEIPSWGSNDPYFQKKTWNIMGFDRTIGYALIMNILITYRPVRIEDKEEVLSLFPELADFELPVQRVAKHLWSGDAEMLCTVLEQKSTVTFADVAVDRHGSILGVIMVTLREELLSHTPSAHLETIIVAPKARGNGLGTLLLERAEQRAFELGAKSLTLHVFFNNIRARSLYKKHGYEEELFRCIKWFDSVPRWGSS
ncbi:MAG: hypothetical protein CL916_07405 [Deltaproteobacteria bacterium]|nr:hypothetical protein [Deltaproteobacteria bacterium]